MNERNGLNRLLYFTNEFSKKKIENENADIVAQCFKHYHVEIMFKMCAVCTTYIRIRMNLFILYLAA